MTPGADQSWRTLEQLVPGMATSDGAGVKLTRLLTQTHHRRLDPFLMLDAFGSDKAGDYIAGFPDHPHRGFETITYMLAGRMRHRDSTGNEGLLEPGGLQWMVTGRGLIHSEMPEQEEGLMAGFQLWLNLPARDKLCEPWYRDVPSASIPEFDWQPGCRIRLMAGRLGEHSGAVERPATEPVVADVLLAPNTRAVLPVPAGMNALVVPHAGSVRVGERTLPVRQMGILSDGEQIELVAGEQGASVLLVAGRPLREPVVQYGPFVMNTVEQLHEAVRDYQLGRLDARKPVKSVG